MPKKAKKAKKARRTRNARYEAYRAEWERKRPHRHRSQSGRGKPGDMDYWPPVIGPPPPHPTKAAAFLEELLWWGQFHGHDSFNQAYCVVRDSGAIKDGKWDRDFQISSPPGHTLDPFQPCVSLVARMSFRWRSSCRSPSCVSNCIK
jgi:hypothetical protein